MSPTTFQTARPPAKASLIVTDPPYNIGHDYGPVSDRLSTTEYLEMMHDFAAWTFEHATKDATLYVVHYPRFFEHGNDIFVNAGGWDIGQRIAWCYPSNIGHSRNAFTTSSRDIWRFTKGKPRFDAKADPEPYRNPTDKRVRKLIESGSPGRAPYDWWVFDLQKNVGKDHAGYANQLPRPLLRRLILTSSRAGEWVFDPFAGTGSTLKEAAHHGRHAYGCEANPQAPACSLG